MGNTGSFHSSTWPPETSSGGLLAMESMTVSTEEALGEVWGELCVPPPDTSLDVVTVSSASSAMRVWTLPGPLIHFGLRAF